ncbi:Caffeine dehydrogenase subunit gamma [bacterium YEK0313]|nr:Caffeine dehydrogenase subunit gamma [bacterium YEK0313]
MSTRQAITVTVNGESHQRLVEPRLSLVDFLRQDLQLTGSHVGCEMGACGACLVLVDDEPVHACLMFAVQAEGARIETVEGLAARDALADLKAAFRDRNALQCGYCTPGMLATAHAILARGGVPSREEIRDALSGNYCRCTGYEAIVDAIVMTAEARAAAGEAAR